MKQLPLGLKSPEEFAKPWQATRRAAARALAVKGKLDLVNAELSAAAAGDFLSFQRAWQPTKAFAAFSKSVHGRAFAKLMAAYRATLIAQLRDAVFVLAHYAPAKPASGSGDVVSQRNAEVFAYIAKTKRFIRLSHTGGQVVALFRDAESARVIYAAGSKLNLATPEPNQKQRGYMRELFVAGVDLKTATPSKRVVFRDVRSVEVFFSRGKAGRTLVGKVVRVRKRKSVTKRRRVAFHTLHLARGTLSKHKWARAKGQRMYVAHGDIVVDGVGAAGVDADWGDEGAAAAFRVRASRKTVTMPGGLLARRDTMRWSPNKGRLVVASRPRDECSKRAKDRMANVYIVDTTTGALTRIARTEAEPSPQWASDRVVLFAAGAGIIKGIDVRTKEIVHRLRTRTRATMWTASAPHCDATP